MQLEIPRSAYEHVGAAPRIDARAEIQRLTAAGYGTTAIARSLNARGVPTPSGRGRWHEGTVRRHGDPHAARLWAVYMRGYRRDRVRRS